MITLRDQLTIAGWKMDTDWRCVSFFLMVIFPLPAMLVFGFVYPRHAVIPPEVWCFRNLFGLQIPNRPQTAPKTPFEPQHFQLFLALHDPTLGCWHTNPFGGVTSSGGGLIWNGKYSRKVSWRIMKNSIFWAFMCFSPNSFSYRGSYFKLGGEGSQILWIRWGGAVTEGVVGGVLWCGLSHKVSLKLSSDACRGQGLQI